MVSQSPALTARKNFSTISRLPVSAIRANCNSSLAPDRRVSGRRDARPALAVCRLLATNPDVFEMRAMPGGSRLRAVELLARYVDQNFSWVDAVVLLSADDDGGVQSLWTVDSSLSVYRFSHRVALFKQTVSGQVPG